MEVHIRSLVPEDWSDVARIYREGIDTGDATFETDVPDWSTWDSGRHPTARIVAVADERILGFATVSPVSKRTVYEGVAEVMVYVAAGARGMGVGRRLMDALVQVTEEAGIWSLQASIFPENQASVAVHQAVGFRIIGTRERIARTQDGRWRDTVIMERRSRVVGTDRQADASIPSPQR